MKVAGVFGGSFSPFHEGHLNVADGVLKEGLVDEVWLMPCKRNPLKDGTTTFPNSERLREIESIAGRYNEERGQDLLKVCGLELEMPEPSYTFRTLEELQKRNPEKEFRLIVGADSYLDFHKWRNYEWIQTNFRPIVYPRPGYEIKAVDPRWTLLSDVAEIDISSTEIRNRRQWKQERN